MSSTVLKFYSNRLQRNSCDMFVFMFSGDCWAVANTQEAASITTKRRLFLPGP